MSLSREEKVLIDGPIGKIEVLIDNPGAPRGIALIGHPHPIGGGAATNKVAHTLARTFVNLGYTAFRPNFRTVGQTEGEHDEGIGETDDMLSVLDYARERCGHLPVALAGFSFGAFVTSHAVAALAPQRPIDKIALIGTAASRFNVLPIAAELHERTLVVHGEADDTVPLASVMDWARPQVLPVTVVPGGGHFFHGQLPLLRELVLRHQRA